MNKRTKSAILLASILASVSLFSGFDTLPAVEALPEGARILLENGIPLSVVQETMNQEAALEAYDTLYANMGIDSIDVSTSETGYPDEYAGEYIDDNGMLVIQLAEYDETLEEKYFAMTGYSDVVRFEYVEYSYNELNEVYQEARRLYADYDIVKSYIDTYNNQIALFVTAVDYNSLLSDEFIQLNDEYIRIEVG